VRDRLPRAGLVDFDELPGKFDTRFAGLLLAMPDLIALDLPGLVKQAGYPGTREIPAISYVASLLLTKLAERVKWVLPVRSVGFRCGSRAC
jgi:hypothetical protein